MSWDGSSAEANLAEWEYEGKKLSKSLTVADKNLL